MVSMLMIIFLLCVSKVDIGMLVHEYNQQHLNDSILEKYNESDYMPKMWLLRDEKNSFVRDDCLLNVEMNAQKNFVFVAR